MMQDFKAKPRGFTLIELLIVVAIIAILAAIAVPNFLEAQMRSKVARVKSDMRSVGISIESYSIDNNGKYPILDGYKTYTLAKDCLNRGAILQALCLTTPIAYMTTTRIMDPFTKVTSSYNEWGDIGTDRAVSFTLCYVNVPEWWKVNGGIASDPKSGNRPKWFMASLGPDYVKGPNPYPQLAPYTWVLGSFSGGEGKMKTTLISDVGFDAVNYDPSNGSTSGGDIIKHQ